MFYLVIYKLVSNKFDYHINFTSKQYDRFSQKKIMYGDREYNLIFHYFNRAETLFRLWYLSEIHS